MMCFYVVFHNFVRTLRRIPAEATGLIRRAMTVSDIVALIDARIEAPKKPGAYKPRQTEDH